MILDRLYNLALSDLEDAFRKVREARLDPDAESDDSEDTDEEDWPDPSDDEGEAVGRSREDEDEEGLGYDMFTNSVVTFFRLHLSVAILYRYPGHPRSTNPA